MNARWYELDLALIAQWDSRVRRTALVVLALLTFCMLSWWLLWPKWQALRNAQHQIPPAQNTWLALAQTPLPKASHEFQINMIRAPDSAQWMADLTQLAQKHGISELDWRLQITDENLQRRACASLAPDAAGCRNGAMPIWTKDVGLVELDAQGDFARLMAYVAAISTRPEWLGVERIELEGVQSQNIHLKIQLWYAQGDSDAP